MDTATVTWITYNNYGTLLQAYALQKKIKEYGHENKILSDAEILKEHRRKKANTEKPTDLGTESNKRSGLILYRLFQLIKYPGRIPRVLLAHLNQNQYIRPYEETQLLCESFKKMELEILEDVTIERLPELNNLFDLFIAGSDQVWSVSESIFNPYYYLNFVKGKKISYAPSLGSDHIPDSIAYRIKELLGDYEAISIREEKSAGQLSNLTGKKIEWTADPTLLHDRKFWTEFAKGISTTKKRYLLCYFLENRCWYFSYAKKVAKRLNLKIVLIPNRWDYLSSEYICRHGVGPDEFVSLIQHAEYVLTDSYHGSIFSIIFNKDFQYLLRFSYNDPKSQNIRIESLFGYLGLNDRIVTEKNCQSGCDSIDYDSVNKKVNELREKSASFLKSNLNIE